MKDETKYKLKKIFISIGAAIAAFCAFILGIVLHNNGRSDERTDRLAKDLSDSTDKLRENNSGLESANTRLSEIIEDIKKTRHGNND